MHVGCLSISIGISRDTPNRLHSLVVGPLKLDEVHLSWHDVDFFCSVLREMGLHSGMMLWAWG